MSTKTTDPIPVAAIMETGRLRNLCAKAQKIARLNEALYHCLSDPLKPYCQLINYELGTLTIAVRNNSMATALYYQQNSLLNELKKSIPSMPISQIKIKVRHQ